MRNFKQILSVYFVWHPSNGKEVKPLVDYCYDRFQRNTNKLFSRSMNLPVFFRTSSNNENPIEIKSTSEKTIIFCFSSVYVTGNKNWREYYNTFFDDSSNYVVPVAMDAEYGYNLDNCYKNINYIRLYDFNIRFLKQYFFINATHEIIRSTFFQGKSLPGDVTAIKLFLSHTKYDLWAVETATILKSFIDESSMHRFFDVNDIHIAHDFRDEIEDNVKKSTLIAIQSDNYSSRYWCQKEILLAKETRQPIIIINHLKNEEDRIFPHSANVPSIRIESNKTISEESIHIVLEIALLETLRHFYSLNMLNNLKDDSTLILSRPPELIDFPFILSNNSGVISKKVVTIIYPEPPVYKNELNFLTPLGINVKTPLTLDDINLKDVSIGISISEVEAEEVLNIGHSVKHLIILSQTIIRQLLFRDATLVYGGDLRPNGFTDYICEEARIVQDRLQDTTPLLINYSAWPIYKNNAESVLEWNSKNNKVARMIEVPPPIKVKDNHDIDTYLPPTNIANCYAWALSLTKMREDMITQCDFRISAGGKLSGYKGKYPGVLKEIIISIKFKKPLFLIGAFGGVTSRICSLLINGITPEEFTIKWQVNHNSGYNEIIDMYAKDIDENDIDYENIIRIIQTYGIQKISKYNGLTEIQNKKLFESEYIDEIILLIIEGLSNLRIL